MREILLFLDACIIMHNFLLMRNDKIIESWIEDDDATVVDSPERLPPEDELNQAVPDGRDGDYRRTQLSYYLQELIG